ncbi:exo-beta-N-acetylmuramidase NamZ domain-containing protein [Carboxylicivirga sp. M1479]|uniref:exo-beta-N-acetylmuramidase NamZ family protein n=1 Tax=Carboxylicivirga sp. M1479 TaxID=2594476 RepID=UPI0011774158|nr:DUF1343 domain-containing protein [Carboxylicivirga sp. M1479]TRX64308.1 DUF1343 domain-containing protein [Carboxylicivirga sp. M1479]
MRLSIVSLIILSFSLVLIACQAQKQDANSAIKLGCQKMDAYLPLLKNKRVGVLVNHTSYVGGTHLIDTLLLNGVNISKIFAPEHGFRGTADAGEYIDNKIDEQTSLPIISLYGKNKKPTQEQLNELDVIVFDIQDVGVRFYTYISSMHYMMEACAEKGISMLILDRPNPNGDYFDGPVLDLKFQSFVGLHPIPVVHGLTVGELALMINGEYWLKDSLQCSLQVIKMDNYKHQSNYSLPIKPSPNLPNDLSIRLYPSLCFFEATDVSIGRGTHMPFQVIGYPDSTLGSFQFTPISIDGMSKHPPQQDQLCYGIDLRSENLAHTFTLEYLIQSYNRFHNKEKFISKRKWFNLLAGNDTLVSKIENGWSEEAIRKSWQEDLLQYSLLRDKYSLYP